MPAVGSRTRKTFFLAFEFVTVICCDAKNHSFLWARIVYGFETRKVSSTFPRKAHTLFIFKLGRYTVVRLIIWSFQTRLKLRKVNTVPPKTSTLLIITQLLHMSFIRRLSLYSFLTFFVYLHTTFVHSSFIFTQFLYFILTSFILYRPYYSWRYFIKWLAWLKFNTPFIIHQIVDLNSFEKRFVI